MKLTETTESTIKDDQIVEEVDITVFLSQNTETTLKARRIKSRNDKLYFSGKAIEKLSTADRNVFLSRYPNRTYTD